MSANHWCRNILGAALVCLAACSAASAQPLRVQYENARKEMVDKVIIGGGIRDERVIEAMLATPRHEFVAA
jgi:phosphoribosylformimino-5-aminoimidazole carboxamide ribonucleotide (ProFAR) isomerase